MPTIPPLKKTQTPPAVSQQAQRHDRNFDDIADHFAHKVYGGLKGEIRLAVLRRDLTDVMASLHQQQQRALRILDVGAGMAQLAIECAQMGHEVTVNDVSTNLLAHAQYRAEQLSVYADMIWHVCPYQQLQDKLTGQYDVIMCHALLEWLAEPEQLLQFFAKWLADDGVVSLCFYNPASLVYRNLMMGNFKLLSNTHSHAQSNAQLQSDNKRSLTPNHPIAISTVKSWLAAQQYRIIKSSGLRVFYDYTSLKRGGLNDATAIIEMEVKYSDQEPYKWLGRYIHLLAVKSEAIKNPAKQTLDGEPTAQC